MHLERKHAHGKSRRSKNFCLTHWGNRGRERSTSDRVTFAKKRLNDLIDMYLYLSGHAKETSILWHAHYIYETNIALKVILPTTRGEGNSLRGSTYMLGRKRKYVPPRQKKKDKAMDLFTYSTYCRYIMYFQKQNKKLHETARRKKKTKSTLL